MDLLESVQADMQRLEQELIRQVQSRVPVAFEIGAHILNSGGKRIRPQLVAIASRMGGYTGPDVLKFAAAIECIHTATLLHDDVVDHAHTRRGIPAANTLWSNEMCVLGGDFILAKAFSLLTSLGNLRILTIVSKTTEQLSEGELLQMMHIGNVDVPEADYLKIITDKTAVLMEAACRGGAILGELDAKREEALARYGFDLGLAFQITDDIIDYRSDRATMGKEPGKDLEEGKLTLPMIFALRSATEEERARVQGILKECRLEDGDLPWLREFLDRRGGIEGALEQSRFYLKRATEHLDIFADSEEKRTLQMLADKIQQRMA